MGPDPMKEIDLLRLLHGELPPARARELSRRIAGEPDLLASYRRLEKVWGGLGADAAVAPRPGFATAVIARVRAESEASAGLGWSMAPAWAKVAALLALAVGAALGSGLMLAASPSAAAASAPILTGGEAALSEPLLPEVTLGEGYAAALQTADAEGLDGVRQ